jgi:hypothetical protein
MPDSADCPLCRSSATTAPRTGDWLAYACLRCGNYSIVDSAEQLLRARPLQITGAVSGWTRQQNAMGITPRIGSNDVDRLRALRKPPFQERLERYLVAAADKAQTLGVSVKIGSDDLIGISYSDHINELVVILDYLRQEGLMTSNLTDHERLTAKGYIAADDLRAKRAASSQAFVAIWFTKDIEQVYEDGFKPAIEQAGFAPMLIKNKEHANKIDDEIIAEIRRSAFLVADFTGQRQNVYFETGFAIGLGRQRIWTCRKDDIKNLHFDIRQYNCIDWENAADLAKRLQLRIEALFGRGPLAPLT